MSDFATPIGDAITTKLAGVSGIRQAKTFGADNLSALPGALVFPPNITLVERSGSHERYALVFPAVIVVQRPAEPERAAGQLVTLVMAAFDSWLSGITLGGLAEDSWITNANWDAEAMLAGDTLPSYGLDISVTYFRNITRTA